ncbi:hypothetical protein F5Y15DRAFT_224111 [Xylariaceae sp. FL0016]|nr:hypothetical protein F5Y15DRAFT_224111 [Xylariaceae sp. FL0016]
MEHNQFGPRSGCPESSTITPHRPLTLRTALYQEGPSRLRQTQGIADWRGRTSQQEYDAHHEPRTSRPTRTRRLESVPNSTSRSRSSGSSGSESDSSSTSRSGSKGFILKYCVRKLQKYCKAKPSDDSEGRKVYKPVDTFISSPKVTFLIDQPDNLLCQICYEQNLRMGKSAADPANSTPSIIPCGHIACHSCFSSWLETKDTCPFCRKSMQHKQCQHAVKPRLITSETIGDFPPTLAEGGKIGELCLPCRARSRQDQCFRKWADAAEKFKVVRKRAEMLDTAEAFEELAKAQKAFEGVPKDNAYQSVIANYGFW